MKVDRLRSSWMEKVNKRIELALFKNEMHFWICFVLVRERSKDIRGHAEGSRKVQSVFRLRIHIGMREIK